LSETSAVGNDKEGPRASSTLAQRSYNAESAVAGGEPLATVPLASIEDSRQIASESAAFDDDMRRQSKPFQSKLTLTLRFPEGSRKSPGRQTAPSAPTSSRSFRNPGPGPLPLKHEAPRLQTFQGGGRQSSVAASGTVPRLAGQSTSCNIPIPQPGGPPPRPLGKF